MTRVALSLLALCIFASFHLVAPSAASSPSALALQATPTATATPHTFRASVGLDGTEGNNNSEVPHISDDGRYVIFTSGANNLIPGDNNGIQDVFVKNLTTGQLQLASITSDGTQANDSSRGDDISADGRYVVFMSLASNLVVNDTNGQYDVFVHDQVTGETARVSISTDGAEGNEWSGYASISGDGRFVAFRSLADTLVPGDVVGTWDVFVHDRQTGETEQISIAPDGSQGNATSSGNPSISADGRYVAFTSYSSNLVSGDTNSQPDVFVRDMETGVTERVSVGAAGVEGNHYSAAPSISGNGRYVAFYSRASNLVGEDTNGTLDVFVHDRSTHQTILTSVSSDGTQTNREAVDVSLSANGENVAFLSIADNLVSDDTNAQYDIFVHHWPTHKTQRVSLAANNAESIGFANHPSISGDGSLVAFQSDGSDLVSTDNNARTDIFVRYVTASPITPTSTSTQTSTGTLTPTSTPTSTPSHQVPTETFTPVSTVTPIITGENSACNIQATVVVCGSVSHSVVEPNQSLTVYGRIVDDNVPQGGVSMALRYNSASPICISTTNAQGMASCFINAGSTPGEQVVTLTFRYKTVDYAVEVRFIVSSTGPTATPSPTEIAAQTPTTAPTATQVPQGWSLLHLPILLRPDGPTATPTITPSATFTLVPSATGTPTITQTPTVTGTPTSTPTSTQESTFTRTPTVTRTPSRTPTPRSGNCDPAYPTVCIPSPPPDLDCGDISYRNFRVLPPDPHNFDTDNDGIGCEN